MTEKRFVAIDDDLVKDTKYGRLINNVVVADMLNCLIGENKKLKADNNRLVNETARIVAEHQKKVLDLIDEKIEEYSPKYKLYNTNAIEVLKELKKELIK